MRERNCCICCLNSFILLNIQHKMTFIIICFDLVISKPCYTCWPVLVKLAVIYVLQQTFFLIVTHFIITYHISQVNVQINYCNNNILNFDVKQLKIMKLCYFYTLKALWYGQAKIKMYYGMSKIKMQLSGKRSIAKRVKSSIICITNELIAIGPQIEPVDRILF